jgi:oxygen-independent coproporphyrinogen-3 oxidase
VDPDLIQRHSKPVPRYTSYPTAPHFHEGVDDITYGSWLEALPSGSRLSLYLHIPYCDRLCWFCGCHTKQTLRYEPIATYLGFLFKEIAAVGARVAGRGEVVAVHLGGGSPSMLRPDDIFALDTHLRENFRFSDEFEYSIEMDPNDMDDARYDALGAIGISRASLGVQDFDPRVQAAVNRIQTFEQTRDVVVAMRERGVGSINLDLLYGLPHQTVDSVLKTVGQVISLRPDRVAIFGYAHVPWMKTHQKMIDESVLPDAAERFGQARAGAAALLAAGYEQIGMDHFALPNDSLAIAARRGKVRRNFQGYTTDVAAALIGFGASAISQLPAGYAQNIVATGEYERRVGNSGLAIAKGIALSEEDSLRAYVIGRLMCDFAVCGSELRERFGDLSGVILDEMAQAKLDDQDGFVDFDGEWLKVTERGKPFVRSVAAVFDARLRVGGARYSLAI